MNITVNPHMSFNLGLLKDAVESGTLEGFEDAMREAAQTAKRIKRWRDAGDSAYVDKSGNLWEWETTGLTENSITGYVLAPGESTNLPGGSGGTSSVRINGRHIWTKVHNLDPSVAGHYTAGPGQFIGVLTMYTQYASYLQAMERSGARGSGIPSAGEMVVVEALTVAGGSLLIAQKVNRAITQKVLAAKAQMR